MMQGWCKALFDSFGKLTNESKKALHHHPLQKTGNSVCKGHLHNWEFLRIPRNSQKTGNSDVFLLNTGKVP